MKVTFNTASVEAVGESDLHAAYKTTDRRRPTPLELSQGANSSRDVTSHGAIFSRHMQTTEAEAKICAFTLCNL